MGEFRFPWLNIGYSLSDYLYLLQPAEIGGIYLLSAAINCNELASVSSDEKEKNFGSFRCFSL